MPIVRPPCSLAGRQANGLQGRAKASGRKRGTGTLQTRLSPAVKGRASRKGLGAAAGAFSTACPSTASLGTGSLRSRALSLCFSLGAVPRPRMSVAARKTKGKSQARSQARRAARIDCSSPSSSRPMRRPIMPGFRRRASSTPRRRRRARRRSARRLAVADEIGDEVVHLAHVACGPPCGARDPRRPRRAPAPSSASGASRSGRRNDPCRSPRPLRTRPGLSAIACTHPARAFSQTCSSVAR